MPFVNAYDFGGPSAFQAIVPASAGDRPTRSAGHLAIGVGNNSGVATRIDSEGHILWSRRYNVDGRPLNFLDGVAAGGDGFALLSTAAMPEGGGLQRYILVRIDAAGSVLWAKQIYSGRTLSATRVLRTREPAEEFHLFGRTAVRPPSVSPSGIELVRLAADGGMLGSTQLEIGREDTIFDAIAFVDGYILVGDSVLPQGRAGLVVHLDPGLKPRGAWLISGEGQRGTLSLRATVAPSSKSFLVAGRAGPDARTQSSLVAELRLGPGTTLDGVGAFSYPVNEGRDQPVQIASFGDDFLVLDNPEGRGPATVLRLNGNLTPKALYGFDFRDRLGLSRLRVHGKDAVLIAGALAAPRPGWDNALLLAVDETFACCKTKYLQNPSLQSLKLTIRRQDVSVTDTPGRSTSVNVPAISEDPTAKPLCDGAVLELLADRLVQSPYLNLQAAGSAGIDAPKGILLRWFLDGILGRTHLPKGALAQNTFNFNKPDDVVTIYRAVWPRSGLPARRLSLGSDRPVYIDTAQRALVFQTGTAPGDLFVVRFTNAAAFLAARQAVDPAQSPAAFIAAYGVNPIEIELRNVLAVACDLEFQPNAASTIRVETLSVAENRPLAATQVTSRRVLAAADGPVARVFAENMRSIRLDCSGTQIAGVSFFAYDDVLTRVNETAGWTQIGKFGLVLDQATVFRRLEDSNHFRVDGYWRKFNDGAFVNVRNYQDRWLDAPNGIAAAVQRYVQLSESDPTGSAEIPGTTPEDGSISISYLDLLNLAALDYHAARMLGLGHVDADGIERPTTYIHVAEYTTLGDLADGKGPRRLQHFYMSLPTSMDQERLPLAPDLDPVEYGLTVPTGDGGTVELTDQQGYTSDGLARYIRLYPGCRPLYEVDVALFNPPDLFDLTQASLPALYGVEYRAQGETSWRRPEIAHDAFYVDTAGIAEAVSTPLPATRRGSAFIHKETEAGIHEYAVHGVNIFSRASLLSLVRATDATAFRRPNRLLPPSDLQVQVIQKESPVVLTTNSEQAMLAALPQLPDAPILVRLSFNYAHAQDANYDFADKVEIFFRQQLPGNVIGGVKATGPGTDPSLIRIETQPYTYLSTRETVVPAIAPPIAPAQSTFLGGALVVGSRRFTIEGIDWPDPSSAQNPVFLVRKPTTTGVIEDGVSNTLVVQDAVLQINPGDLVMAIENMAASANWGSNNPLSMAIAIGDPSWPIRTESFVRSDGSQVTRRLRGIWQPAQIDPVPNPPGTGPSQYDITFANLLAPHSQSSAADPVNWHKGIVRVPVAGRDPEDRRALTVLRVEQPSPGTLRLRALNDSGDPQPVVTSGNPLVNYYPGYKIYLHADSARGFDAGAILPAQGEGSRKTLVGVRSVDTTTLDEHGLPYHSLLGVPQPLVAVEIIEPQIPQIPTGLKYATPPDAYGKSSYTLTVNFASGHKPFAAVFYRADALSILRAIYEPTTFEAVRAIILPPEKDPFITARFADLFGFLTSPDEVVALAPFPMPDGGSYALPPPDEPALDLASAMSLADRKPRIREAVLEVFLPLTEQPLIYDLIRSDPAYIPTNKPQVFRDSNEDLLAPAVPPTNPLPGPPPFDLAPMAKRSETNGTHAIQFTDFTLDGSMNPNTVYFYCAREIGNRMQLGEPSPVFGPVKLVNLSPPSAPRLRKIITVPYDVPTGRNPEVRFEVVVPSSTDPVSRICIYRSVSAADALTLRTMIKVGEVDLATLTPTADGTLVVADVFAPGSVVPYGDPLFYRLAWVRDVAYQDVDGTPVTAAAISEPTQTFVANLIDVVNPTAPMPTFHLISTTITGEKLLRMSWAKAVHNGTYYVSRLAPSGNWVRVTNIQSNDALVTYDLPDSLPVDNEDGQRIYYRFKVDVENSSGLLNLVDAPITTSLESISS